MTEPIKYNIATLVDIAMIPKDRIPQLLSELPRMLDTIRPIVSLVKHDPESLKLIAKELSWIDDGVTDGHLDHITVTVEASQSPQ